MRVELEKLSTHTKGKTTAKAIEMNLDTQDFSDLTVFGSGLPLADEEKTGHDASQL